MTVRRSEVDRIAVLAHLELSEAESDRLAVELSGILDHVSALGTDEGPVDTVGTDVSPEPCGDETLQTPDALMRPPADLAPAWRDGFFVVPRLSALGTRQERRDTSE